MPILFGIMSAVHTHSWLRFPSYWIGLVLFDQMPRGGYWKRDKGREKEREDTYERKRDKERWMNSVRKWKLLMKSK